MMLQIQCKVCNENIEEPFIKTHLEKSHPEMTLRKYEETYPDASLICGQARLTVERDTKGLVRRAAVKTDDTLIMGVPFEIHDGVLLDACLSSPEAYHFPTKGDIVDDLTNAALLIKGGENTWIHGPPGSGKDAFFKAFSERTRTPALLFQVNQDTNLQSWFYRRGFSSDGSTLDEDGKLLQACRDGYKTEDGRKIPYLIVLSDFDRADPRKMENFRAMLESDGRRIPGAQGKFYPMLKGTIFGFTANSVGGGDEHGRCISANPIDSSFLDRVQAVKIHSMLWEDEFEILKELCPKFIEWATAETLNTMKSNVEAIRTLISNEELNIEFTTRTVISWAKQVERVVKYSIGKDKDRLLRGAKTAFVDKAGDQATREILLTTLGAGPE